MPFKLCNTSATLQRLIRTILGPMICYCVLVYLDDVLILATTIGELLNTVEVVLRLLINANLK